MSAFDRAEAAWLTPSDEIDAPVCTCGDEYGEHLEDGESETVPCTVCDCEDFREQEPYTRDDWEADEADRLYSLAKEGL